MRAPPKSREARRCQSHCSECGSHFFSDSAFDAHRRGFVCWEEGCDERVRVLSENAVCSIAHDPPLIGVVLYGVNPDFRSNSPSLAPTEAEGGVQDRNAA